MFNKILKAMFMDKKLLIKKILGYEEIFTCAYKSNYKNENLVESSYIQMQTMPYDKKYWYADPILFELENITYIFMEAFDRKANKGKVAVSFFDSTGVISQPKIVIDEKFHLSFPMVFIYRDEYYMIPETSEIKELCIYKVVNFPYNWEILCKIPLDYYMVDTSIIEIDELRGDIVIMSSVFEKATPLLTKFIMHKLNINAGKVKLQEIYCEENYGYDKRNAGKLIKYKGEEYIPTQVSTEFDYGVSLRINKLHNQKTPKLERVRDITSQNICLPDYNKKVLGIHTYGLGSNYEIVDIKILDFNWLKWYNKLFKK